MGTVYNNKLQNILILSTVLINGAWYGNEGGLFSMQPQLHSIYLFPVLCCSCWLGCYERLVTQVSVPRKSAVNRSSLCHYSPVLTPVTMTPINPCEWEETVRVR